MLVWDQSQVLPQRPETLGRRESGIQENHLDVADVLGSCLGQPARKVPKCDQSPPKPPVSKIVSDVFAVLQNSLITPHWKNLNT